MINIVVCDDNEYDVELIKNSLVAVADIFGGEIHIASFYNTKDVEGFLVNDRIDYAFLDIELPGTDGFSLAEAILNKYAEARIFFVSNYEERVFESFRYNPPKFIRKRKFDMDMAEAAELLKKWIRERLQVLYVKVDNENVTIKVEKIRYIDTCQNYIVYHLTNNSRITQRKTIKSFMEQNPCESLLKVNAGCIVNMRYVLKIKNRRIYLTSGEDFGIGRSIEKEIKRKFVRYKLETEEVM
ncbi:MAG: LytTR family transcriptional regulator DNA-binding domain-containing protein [Alistipes sp.]|nr:LytTR family transcriptional regulator DNA-binding domain-containing protein [Alistipes sp.]